MEDLFKDKTILLTGGTGSFGNKFVELLLKNHSPKSIRIYSRNELKQIEMERKFECDSRLRFFIGDVRDGSRLNRAMNGADYVVHAAALKHVPVCEYNPMEAIKTNIEGAQNLINAAIDNGVEKVVALSTDKAVEPANLYGATKMVAEKLFIQSNAYSGSRKTRFSCVRYGNVIGSSGSVVPLFKNQAKTGTITLTDARMTRFWITLDQGVGLVKRAFSEMSGGEIFIPKIPSTKITDLAAILAPNAKINTIGMRAGEKLHEILITEEEARHSVELKDHYLVLPELNFWDKSKSPHKPNLKEGFSYSSDNNSWWLNQDEIKALLKKEGWLN
jgi:UDP-N-acetylglucosamine 4,6-dehydratase (inverting)